MLGNHDAFRSSDTCVQVCVSGTVLLGALLTLLTLLGQGLQAEARSDSGRRQLNYSQLMGGVSAAAISTYTYHPQSERSFSNVMSVWGTQMAWDAAKYMIKEFLPDLRKQRKNSH